MTSSENPRAERLKARLTEIFLGGDEDPSFEERPAKIKRRPRTTSVITFEELSPFPHCVLPVHFFDRFSTLNTNAVNTTGNEAPGDRIRR